MGSDSTEGWLVRTTDVVGGTDTKSPLGAPDTFSESDIGAERPGICTCTFCRPCRPCRLCRPWSDVRLRP